MSKTIKFDYEVRCTGGTEFVNSWAEARDLAANSDRSNPDCAPHHAYRVKTTTTVEATRPPARKAKS